VRNLISKFRTKNIRNAFMIASFCTAVLTVAYLPQSVHCAVCNEHAEYSPSFIYHTCKLPDTVHWECLERQSEVGTPYSPSYPRSERLERNPES
jgi:hypothetical protein